MGKMLTERVGQGCRFINHTLDDYFNSKITLTHHMRIHEVQRRGSQGKGRKKEGNVEREKALYLKVLFNLVQLQAACSWIPSMDKCLILNYTSE